LSFPSTIVSLQESKSLHTLTGAECRMAEWAEHGPSFPRSLTSIFPCHALYTLLSTESVVVSRGGAAPHERRSTVYSTRKIHSEVARFVDFGSDMPKAKFNMCSRRRPGGRLLHLSSCSFGPFRSSFPGLFSRSRLVAGGKHGTQGNHRSSKLCRAYSTPFVVFCGPPPCSQILWREEDRGRAHRLTGSKRSSLSPARASLILRTGDIACHPPFCPHRALQWMALS
jgi:hypothetical protein